MQNGLFTIIVCHIKNIFLQINLQTKETKRNIFNRSFLFDMYIALVRLHVYK